MGVGPSEVRGMGTAAPAGECFERAFVAVRGELVRALGRLLGSPEDAQDVAQEAFLKCWRTRGRLAEVRDLKAWIFRVGLNAARDLRRNVWRQRWRPLADPAALAEPPTSSPPELAQHGETLARLRAALADLRPAERSVFLLRQQGGLTYEQIAARLRVPVGTVKTRMRSALAKLRKVLPWGRISHRG
jgi:RNA polymerase sigma-70 factor, ECF subfamily